MSKSYCVAGVMSGTSLDGLDMVLCNFIEHKQQWTYSVELSDVLSYSEEWGDKLRNACKLSAEGLVLLDQQYGVFIAESLMDFLGNRSMPDLIASHGHTVFHSPQKAYTCQIGSGTAIAAMLGTPEG